MNKHTYTAYSLSIFAIFGSLLLWTNVVAILPSPHVPQRISEFLQRYRPQEPLAVHSQTIDALGEHFVTSVQRTHLTASVTHTESRQEIAKPKVQESMPEAHSEEQSAAEVVKPEELEEVHAAADEVEQWGLVRAWTIAIPRLGIRAPILLPTMDNWSARAWDMLEEQMQIGLHHGTVAYPHSVNPGAKGNLIIAGHSSPPDEASAQSAYGSVFAALPDIQIGETIKVSSSQYVVEDKFVVSPQETSILEQQDDESLLKLITCYPVGTTRERMIVVARKVED